MQNVVHPPHRPHGGWHVGEVALEEVDARQVFDVGAIAAGEAVHDAHHLSSSDQRLGEVRADEARSARH